MIDHEAILRKIVESQVKDGYIGHFTIREYPDNGSSCCIDGWVEDLTAEEAKYLEALEMEYRKEDE